MASGSYEDSWEKRREKCEGEGEGEGEVRVGIDL